MCGICGIYCRKCADKKTVLRQMNSLLFHRGPDNEGYHVDGPIGLGHRRLRIIDLEGGDQPLFNEDGRVSVVFNGEIYNYQELRDELIKKGHRFITQSDTETIVHLYEEYGIDCVIKLNGMFAFAIWDARNQCLFLARDRLGVKPLVYSYVNGCFLFASEIKSLAASGFIDLEIDSEAVHSYLTFGYIPAPLTIYKNIKKLEPGHYLVVGNHFVCKRYWHVLDTHIRELSYTDAKDRLRSLILDATQRRMISDVPLGAFLSGGFDSTLITGLMSRLSDQPVKTFSIGFPGQQVLDESQYAQQAAQFYNTEHETFDVLPADLMGCIPDVLNRLGEPFSGGGSILPTYLVSKMARKQVTVVLSGDGADELFAGYEKYLGFYYRRYYHLIPGHIRRQCIEPLIRKLPASRENRALDFIRKLKRFVDGVADCPAVQHFSLMQVLSPEMIAGLVPYDCKDFSNQPLESIRSLFDQYNCKANLTDQLNPMLYVDFSFALPNDMLLKVDLASMYNSLEVRSPFLDYRIAELAYGIPGAFKMKGKNRKIILKETFKDILPPFVHRRPKKGFDVPLGKWLKSELRDLFWDTVRSKAGPVELNTYSVESLYRDHTLNRFDYSKQLWAIFVLKYWSGQIAR